MAHFFAIGVLTFWVPFAIFSFYQKQDKGSPEREMIGGHRVDEFLKVTPKCETFCDDILKTEDRRCTS